MHIHILGIAGTFMGSLAQLAKAQGHRVTGCDKHVYPPMSTQLEQAGIELIEGFSPDQLTLNPDLVVVGNAMSRGNDLVEALLESTIPFMSGPQWLHDYVLPGKWVLGVSGTHGKTSTSSMLAWILEAAGMKPGYLIGGVPKNFEHSARLSDESPFFVVEADEYDTAFFDKRSKFVHYAPRTLIVNNLEFDHADIFDDLAAIQKQFHHLLRIVPRLGLVIYPSGDQNIQAVVEKGCWSETQTLALLSNANAANPNDANTWQAKLLKEDGSQFELHFCGQNVGTVNWALSGNHNVLNALAAVAAAHHAGVQLAFLVEAIESYQGVARRLEELGTFNTVNSNKVTVYDDFAHHPTAIKTTLAGLRAKVGKENILALIEPRSNTMRAGVHKDTLAKACEDADEVYWYQAPEIHWNLQEIIKQSPVPAKMFDNIESIIQAVCDDHKSPLHVVIMSNGGFGGIQQKLIGALNVK